MSPRNIPSISVTGSSVVRTRHLARITSRGSMAYSQPVYGKYMQARMIWGRSRGYAWYGDNNHHGTNRVHEFSHDTSRVFRDRYNKRIAKLRSVTQNPWKGDIFEGHCREKAQAESGNTSTTFRRRRVHDNMDEWVKAIESDPYNFLFGRSNEYLQFGKDWSSSWRSFLRPFVSGSRNKCSPSMVQAVSSEEVAATGASTKASVSGKDGKAEINTWQSDRHDNENVYDPISGRMRPRDDSRIQPTGVEIIDGDRTRDNSVKRFEASDKTKSDDTAIYEPQSTTLKETIPSAQDRQASTASNSVIYLSGPTEIQSAAHNDDIKTLDNGLPRPAPKITQSPVQQKLKYDEQEIKEDDVDLLRASDIRASFFVGETKQETARKKKQLREAMEKDYTSVTSEHLDELILKELREKRNAKHSQESGVEEEILAETPETVQISSLADSSAAGLDDNGQSTHPEQTKETTAMMKKWKAALEETGAQMRRVVKDLRLLTSELQEICDGLVVSTDIKPDTLRILAFDPTSSQIIDAETISSSVYPAVPVQRTADALLKLNKPAQFLPYFAKMKADGYEIVSGGGDILIFRKLAGLDSIRSSKLDAAAAAVVAKGTDSNRNCNMKSDNVSPTPRISINPEDDATSRIVRRQETVYTGAPLNWSPYEPSASASNPDPLERNNDDGGAEGLHAPGNGPKSRSSPSSRLGRGIRHIVLSGVATAGTFYAIGVVCEYFLTGGQDGLGPEGFSEFEAERRRREL